MKIDPHNKHTDVSREDMLNMLGMIPHWINNADPRPAKEQLEVKYGMGQLIPMSTSIDKDGVYHSAYEEEGDDPLWPLAEMVHLDDIIYVYEYGIVAIVDTKTSKSFVTRMD